MSMTMRDEILSPLWILAPFIAVMMAFVLGMLFIFFGAIGGLFLFLLGGIAALVLFLYLNYILIARMNRHIAREAEVRRAMIDRVLSDSLERGTSAAVEPYIYALEGIDQQARLAEAPRSTLWSLVILIPFIGVILYFYMLTLVFSPFLIYWYLKLIDDPNAHFREMWAFEDGFWSNGRGASR